MKIINDADAPPTADSESQDAEARAKQREIQLNQIRTTNTAQKKELDNLRKQSRPTANKLESRSAELEADATSGPRRNS